MTAAGTGSGAGSPLVDDALEAAARAHFLECRARIDGFVRERFRLRGTLRLHRAALGRDLLRAPVNVLLAPAHVLISLVALFADRVRLRRLSRLLRRRTILLDTDVGLAVERLVAQELLGLRPSISSVPEKGESLSAAMLTPAPLHEVGQRLGDPLARDALGRRMARSLRDYAGTRGAVAEATTALATLCAGALVFSSLTPGVVSMTPSVAALLTNDAAVSRFPLGETLGAIWFGAFPASVPFWLLGATLLVLMLIGAVFAAFAGIVADPLQARLGIHRRRLLRLVDALEGEVSGALSTGFAAREHYYARLFDVVDAGVSVLRIFRG